MSLQALITLAITILAVLLLVTERLRADIVALLVVVSLGITGILTPREAFSGFSSSAVVTIVAIFVLTEGLRVGGITDLAGELLLRVGGANERRLAAIVMLIGALLSLVMNNIAAAAVLLPAVTGLARRTRTNPAKLLMPLAFGTLLGGMATLFTTTNIIVSGLLRSQGLRGFGVLDFLPVGLPLIAVGIAYMTLWGQRVLSTRAAETLPTEVQRHNLLEVYRLGERLFRVRVHPTSRVAGKRLIESGLREAYHLSVVAIQRAGQDILLPEAEVLLRVGDILLLEGRFAETRAHLMDLGLEIIPAADESLPRLQRRELALIEAILAPRSTFLGQTLRSTQFREKYGMTVLGIWRAGQPIRTDLAELPLQFGDAMLLLGPVEHVSMLRTEQDLIILCDDDCTERIALTPRKGGIAIAIMILTLLATSLYPDLIGELMLGGALAMVLAGTLTMDRAYQAIEWRSVFLIAGMLPLGIAMTNSGAATLLADRLTAALGPAGPLAMLAGLFLLATVLTQAINGAAVATVVAPIAIHAAAQIGADPRALAMGVALATSMAFITPLGHAVNILVMGPGGYHVRDYARVGLPMVIILTVVVLAVLPIFWPLVAR
jgi:di/tricarboxylate transporter